MLVASSMAAVFGRARVTVTEAAQAPERRPAESFPAYEPSALTLEGPGQGTGFFRVLREPEREGKEAVWWLTDPQGARTLSLGTDHVRYQGHWCQALGYAPHGRVMEKKHGSAEAWGRFAAGRLREWGFNVLGAGNSREARYQGLAHTEFLSFGAAFSSTAALVEKTFWTGWPDVFDPRFERFCELQARKRCAPLRQDPWLMGYFLDNELEWWGKSHRTWGLAEDTCKLPAAAAGKKALVDTLRGFFAGQVAGFNEAFGANLASWDGLLEARELPQPKTERAQAALEAFIALAAERYFRITTAAVRRHDPHHLILGCRFAHDAPQAAWRQAGATCDVVTVNMYPRIDLWRERALGVEEHLRARFALCGKPLILTEWSFPALDAKDAEGRPLPSRHGAGMRVDSQEQRAACYAIMQRTLCSLPFVIGSHYFMWVDEPALGISREFPEDSNYGLISESGEPYAPLTEAAARVNPLLPALHAGKIPAEAVISGLTKGPAGTSGLPRGPGELRWERTGSGYRVETGPLRLEKDGPGGAIFDRVSLRGENGREWVEAGNYQAVLHVTAQGRDAWPHAAQVNAVEVREQTAEKLVLEVAVAGDAALPWKAGYRLTFERGLPSFQAQGLWVENAAAQAWHLGSYFHYLPSRIGGKAEDDEIGGPGVPNYWLKMSTWRDPGLRLHYGVIPPQRDERVSCNFWKEGASAHPDCWRAIERELQPGERWTADAGEPEVTVFALREVPGQALPWISLAGSRSLQDS